MNREIEDRLAGAFGVRAALITESDLTPAGEIALVAAAPPQRRVLLYSGIAVAAVALTIGGALGVAAASGSGHSGTPAGSGGSSPATIAISTSANTVSSPTPTEPQCSVATVVPDQKLVTPATCGAFTVVTGPPSASPTGAYSTVANPPDKGAPSPTISNDSRTVAASPSN